LHKDIVGIKDNDFSLIHFMKNVRRKYLSKTPT